GAWRPGRRGTWSGSPPSACSSPSSGCTWRSCACWPSSGTDRPRSPHRPGRLPLVTDPTACPTCGATLPCDAAFCTSCGASISAAPAPAAAPPASPAPPAPPAPPPPTAPAAPPSAPPSAPPALDDTQVQTPGLGDATQVRPPEPLAPLAYAPADPN